jgi:riboflavin kinase / FMN adenylyltransferase
MRIIDGLEALTRPPGAREAGARSVVAIGKFDGVHRGHQALIHAAVGRARAEGAESVVVTFDRHPIELLQPGTRARYLTPIDEKLRLIGELGVDATLLIRLSDAFLRLTPEEFVRSVLVEKLRMVAVVASDSFRFGRGATGTVETLRELGRSSGYCFQEVPPLIVNGSRVSSSRIVESIRAGRVEEAATLLGRPYALLGRVVHGDKIGRQLGFPTANLEPDERQHEPADGVYAGLLAWNGEEPRPAACNLGTRPTVGGTKHVVEAHVLHFDGDLYDRSARLLFARRLRDELCFPDLETLRTQIAADVARTEEVLRKDARTGYSTTEE